jgi:hypothetical protein
MCALTSHWGSPGRRCQTKQLVQKILPKRKGACPTVGKALEQVVRLTAGAYPLSHVKAEEMLDGFHQHGFASYF